MRINGALLDLIGHGRLRLNGKPEDQRFLAGDFRGAGMSAGHGSSQSPLLAVHQAGAFGDQDAMHRCDHAVLDFHRDRRRLPHKVNLRGDTQAIVTGRKGQAHRPLRRRLEFRKDARESLRAVIEALHQPG